MLLLPIVARTRRWKEKCSGRRTTEAARCTGAELERGYCCRQERRARVSMNFRSSTGSGCSSRMAASLAANCVLLAMVMTCLLQGAHAQTQVLFSVNETAVPGECVHDLTGPQGNLPLGTICLQPPQNIPFAIDATSLCFEVAQGRDLDYESLPDGNNQITFQAVCTLPSAIPLVLSITVTILDVNDNAPRFSPSSINITLNEGSVAGTLVTGLNAVDPDSGTLGQAGIVYKLDPLSNVDNIFQIIGSSGTSQLVVRGPLDHEGPQPNYTVTVLAEDGGGRTGRLTVHIKVGDVNDNAPVFVQRDYSASVNESLRLHTPVLTVRADDDDSGPNANVQYSISMSSATDGNGSLLTIDPHSGAISTTRRPLTLGVHTFALTATDGAFADTATLTLTVQDVNDNRPTLTRSCAHTLVFEEPGPAVGTTLCQFYVTDTDLALNGLVNISLAGSNGIFVLSLPTSELVSPPVTVPVQLAAALDYETATQHTIQLTVADNGSPSLSSTLDVLVLVNDSNEFPPRFQADGYRLVLEEDTATDVPVLTVSATDPDRSSSSITYSIESVTSLVAGGWFRMDALTGVIYTTSTVDREILPVFNLTVGARDTGLQGGVAVSLLSTVIVEGFLLDVNDNAPMFFSPSYSGRVLENSTAGTSVAKVVANDQDDGDNGTVVFALLNADGTPSADFSVDSFGEVTVSAGSALDRETRDSFSLTCVASDLGQPPLRAQVPINITVVDVNDHPPVLYPLVYHCNIRENMAAGQLCTTISATDDDLGENARVTYRILGGNTGSRFTVDGSSGELTNASPLDADTVNTYTLTVQAVDAAGLVSLVNAVVNISVLNERDVPPAFINPEYSFSVAENATLATIVGSVMAASQEVGTSSGAILYSIASGDPSNEFTVNRTSGIITTNMPLDRERQDFYELQLEAEEVGSPPLYTLVTVNISIVDVNDNPPSFGKDMDAAYVRECHPVNADAIYTANATDSDFHKAGRVRYSLLNTSDSGFAIDKLSGELTLTQSLDFEQARYETVLIKAADRGAVRLTSTLTLSINVLDCNDIAPVFTQSLFTGSVNEAESPPMNVLRVSATDDDFAGNTTLTYSLLSPGKVPFGIMPKSGYIYVSQPLDRENTSVYRFTVVVSDGLLRNQSTVEISITDTNDNAPVFSTRRYVFSTPEFDYSRNLPALPAYVGTVNATDTDLGSNAAVRYSLATNTSDFTIDSKSGEISVLSQLDREAEDMYWLEVVARDKGNPSLNSTSMVQIIVTDVNDHAPVFVQPPPSMKALVKIDETAPIGMVLFTVKAQDADDGENARVTFRWGGHPPALFSLNETSGVISTIAPLDYESSQLITLSINATDGGSPQLSSFAKIDIQIRDINDEPPVFVNTSGLTLSFVEDHPVNTELTRIIAVDREDMTNGNGRVRYSLVSQDAAITSMFTVDVNTGAIYLRRAFNYSSVRQFTLIIQASDQPTIGTQMSSTYTLNLDVLQDKDTGPYFPKPISTVDVLENVTVGTRFLRVLALDRDAGSNGKLQYRILSQVPERQVGAASTLAHFAINNSTGWLSTVLPLDFESVQRFYLDIQATDMSASMRSANASLTIQVVNQNEHSPVFPPDQLLRLFEDERLDRVVFTATAQDQDDGVFGQIVYAFRLSDGSLALQDGPFSINATTGQVWLKSGLDYERRRYYVLQIRGSDTLGDPSGKYSELMLNVSVQDVNDNPPKFMNSMYLVEVDENEPAGHILLAVKATDSDSGNNSRITYTLPPGEGMGKFTVDAQTGVVRTTVPLDRESGVERYVLTIIARDAGSPVMTASVDLIITVNDVNDCTPKFFVPSILYFIQENQQKKTIDTLLVRDCDKGPNARLSYSIISGNEGNQFDISSRGGLFVIQNALDRENQTFHQLVIQACDSPVNKSEMRCGVAMINISVTDDNDNSPVFVQASYSGAVKENATIGQSVLRVNATDDDSPLYGLLRYEMTDPTGHFVINSTSGVISVAKELNHEDLSVYTLTVEAADNDPHGARRSSVTVTIAILDVNDFTPTFTHSAYAINVSDSIAVAAPVFNLTAFDIDSGENGRITYRLSRISSDFNIAASSGLVTTRTALSVAKSPYTISVIATDAGVPSRSGNTTLTVNVLPAVQAPPRFLEDVTTVLYKVGTIRATERIAEVSAITDDPTATLSYSIVSTLPPSYRDSFALSAGTGVLTAVKDVALMSSNRVQVLVQARNTATGTVASSTVQLQRDLLQHTFLYFISSPLADIPETAPKGTLVTTVVAKSAFIQSVPQYSIIAGNTQQVFTIDGQSGSIHTQKELDYEMTTSYTISVMATDVANFSRPAIAVIQVDVRNANDNPPAWRTLPTAPVVISENWPPHQYLTTVQAVDVDMSPLTYRIVNQPPSLFTVSPKGEILLGTVGVDYEASARYVLNVTCTDGISTISALVVVDVTDDNDNAPVFFPKQLNKVIAENEPPGLVIARVRATDRDSGVNSEVTFHLLDNINNSLAINSSTGEVTLLKSIPFKRHANKYFVTIVARDGGTPQMNSTLILILDISDINDHSPVFEQPAGYVFNISENTATQNLVGSVHATDDDSQKNALISYNLVAASKYFSINQGNGDIYLLRTVDHEVDTDFTLNVSASDDGNSIQHVTYVLVTIRVLDANDNAPHFEKPEYVVRMPIDQPLNVELVRVKATDADEGFNAKVSYSIKSGDENNIFYLDFNTGSLFLHRNPRDQISPGQAISLGIQATDGSFLATAKVTIIVFSSSQTDPLFTSQRYQASVPENAPKGKSLLQIQALHPNPQLDINYYFALNTSASVRRIFMLDEMTGELTIKAANALDYETNRSYAFWVQGRDPDTAEISAYTQVIINVTNINEYKPRFAQRSYEFDETLPLPVGSRVGNVIATDDDHDPVQYYFNRLNNSQIEDGLLRIDVDTGLITLGKELSKDEVIEAQVIAFDGQGTAVTNVTVNLQYGNTGASESGSSNTSTVLIVAVVIVVLLLLFVLIVVILVLRKRSNHSKELHRLDSNYGYAPSSSGSGGGGTAVRQDSQRALLNSTSTSMSAPGEIGSDSPTGMADEITLQRINSGTNSTYLTSANGTPYPGPGAGYGMPGGGIAAAGGFPMMGNHHEQLHEFGEEGAGEAWGGLGGGGAMDMNTMIYSRLAEIEADEHEAIMDGVRAFNADTLSYAGSIGSVARLVDEVRGNTGQQQPSPNLRQLAKELGALSGTPPKPVASPRAQGKRVAASTAQKQTVTAVGPSTVADNNLYTASPSWSGSPASQLSEVLDHDQQQQPADSNASSVEPRLHISMTDLGAPEEIILSPGKPPKSPSKGYWSTGSNEQIPENAVAAAEPAKNNEQLEQRQDALDQMIDFGDDEEDERSVMTEDLTDEMRFSDYECEEV
ncbi:protocadherin Fat 4-like [Sycon ciliatum]|uniref:protocadherin Fat 4-like n=1 Tax=Sycon ciliatum TaxID=27933 RepID=UPI0031F6D486